MSTSAVTPDPYASIAKPIQADPYASIAKPIAPPPEDSRNFIQRGLDAIGAPLSADEKARIQAQSGPAAAGIAEMGTNALNGLIQPISHPIETVKGIAQSVMSPGQAAKAAFDAARANPMAFGGQMQGGALMGAGAGMLREALPIATDLGKATLAKIPTRAGAGEIFNKLNTQLADQPVQLSSASAPLQRAIEIAARGGTMPAPVKALLERSQAIEPMTFPEARDYQASLSDLSASDKLAMNGRMKGAVAQLNRALYQDIRQAAESGGGMGPDFDKAMREYRQASQIRDAVKATMKYGGRAAAGAAGAGALYQLGQEIK